MSQQATKISQPIRDSRLLAGQESRTFGSEIKQGNAYFRLEDEEKYIFLIPQWKVIHSSRWSLQKCYFPQEVWGKIVYWPREEIKNAVNYRLNALGFASIYLWFWAFFIFPPVVSNILLIKINNKYLNINIFYVIDYITWILCLIYFQYNY